MSERTLLDMVNAALEEHKDDAKDAILIVQTENDVYYHSTTQSRVIKVGMLEVAKDMVMRAGDES